VLSIFDLCTPSEGCFLSTRCGIMWMQVGKFRIGDKATFMGKAEIPAISAQAYGGVEPKPTW